MPTGKAREKGREIYYHINVNKINEIDKWVEQFKKILETQFIQLDNVLLKLKNRNNEIEDSRKKKMKNN